MAVTFERLRARLGCCRIALESANGEMVIMISLAQRNALEDLMSRCTLNAEERAALVSDIDGCKFTPNDALALVHKVVGKPKAAKQWQDYTLFDSYIPEELQDEILAKTLHPHQVQDRMFVFLGKLGFRRGTEHTYKRLSSFLNVVCESSEKRAQMTAHAKWVHKNAIKDRWLKYAKTLPNLDPLCLHLPLNPAGLLLKLPDLYKAVLGDSEPCKPKWNTEEVLAFDLSFTCRNEGSSHKALVQVTTRAPANPPLHIDTFSELMINGMKQLQSMNMQMVQGMLNGRQTGLVLTDPNRQEGLSRIVGGMPFSRPYHRNATMELTDAPQGPRAECNDQLAIRSITDRPEHLVHVSEEHAVVPLQDSEPNRDVPKNVSAKPSVASVLLAISDRNRERTQERADEKKKKEKEAKENAEKEEKAKMMRMIEASGREDPGAIAGKVGEQDHAATADKVGDGVGAVTPTETPAKRRRLKGKQALGEVAAYTPPKPEKPSKPPSCSVERSRSQVLFRTGLSGAGQSTAIAYGKGEKYADEHAALAVARELVIEMKKKRGLLP